MFRNVFRKVKHASIMLGFCYMLYQHPFVHNKIVIKCNQISLINKLIPSLIKINIPNKAIALQVNANNPVEDKFIMQKITLSNNSNNNNNNNAYFLAVFDGHGGYQLSEYVTHHLVDNFKKAFSMQPEHTSLEDKIITSLHSSFNTIETNFYNDSLINYVKGNGRLATVGSCALVAVVANHKLYIANLGDSKARIFSRDNNNAYNIIKGSVVYNARKKFEQERLVKEFPNEHNIYVCSKPDACYVKGRLQPTRTFGDFHLKYSEFNAHISNKENSTQYKKQITNFKGPYISAIPDIKVFDLTERDDYLLLASDGLWDNLKSREVKKLLHKGEDDIEKLSYSILGLCLNKAATNANMKIEDMLNIKVGKMRRNIHDDITMILFDLRSSNLL